MLSCKKTADLIIYPHTSQLRGVAQSWIQQDFTQTSFALLFVLLWLVGFMRPLWAMKQINEQDFVWT